ncbi:MAG: hypothetical protein GX030_10805 [Firmicutes bacterium]|nr:hypothetical protein [Bacillota bacterium]
MSKLPPDAPIRRILRSRRYDGLMREEALQEAMLLENKSYVGSLERRGEMVDYYRLEEDGHVTFVYNVRE